MIANFIYSMLLILCFLGLMGLYFFNDYIKKISSLVISYSSLIVFIFTLSIETSNFYNSIKIIITLFLIVLLNLIVGITIIKNISETSNN
jgi:hypothetical protein